MIDPNLKHFEITLGGEACELRFTGEAMVRGEEWTGLPWTLWDYTRHSHLSAAIAAGILHAEPKITPSEVLKRMELPRFKEYVRLVIDAVEYAHTGKTRAEREAERAKEEKRSGEAKPARRRPGRKSSS